MQIFAEKEGDGEMQCLTELRDHLFTGVELPSFIGGDCAKIDANLVGEVGLVQTTASPSDCESAGIEVLSLTLFV